MSTLTEAASALAGRTPDQPLYSEDLPDDSLAEPDLGDLSKDAEELSAVRAWSRVMAEVRAIGKNERFEGGKAGRFNFRGIETALNAFGPACRKHGVLVIQHKVETEYRDISTSSGGRMRECTALVTFRVYGPDGSFFETQAAGEASDSGGRSTPKAQSIALRTLLINNGLVPTQDRDADRDHFERGEAPIRPAVSYVDEISNPKTSVGRLRQIHQELQATKQVSALVTNEVGDEEQIGAMVVRIGKERAAAGGAQ
jgi:hypothetical protein